MALTKDLEHKYQSALIYWFRLQYPALKSVFFAIPNGGDRNIRVARKLKKEGVLAGVSDLFLAYPSKGFHGMFLEMKTETGELGKNQRIFIEAVRAQNYAAEVAYGLDEAKAKIASYLDI